MDLEALSALARQELTQLNFPAGNWVPPAPGPDGELMREGVRNLRCVDRAPRGREGPWTTFARMDILRSPKHLTGPDLGVAALTYRAYHEDKFGAAHWKKLHK